MRRAEGKREGEGGGKVISSLPPFSFFFFACLAFYFFATFTVAGIWGSWWLVGWLVVA